MELMQELGSYLQQERLSRQIPLDELSRHTCISKNMLAALEEGRLQDVGTPLLIRGFVRAYCRAIGIEPEPVIDRYAELIAGLNEQDASIDRYRAWMKRPPHRRRYLLYSFLACLILVGGFIAASVLLPARSGKNSLIAKAPEALVHTQKELPEDLPRLGMDQRSADGAPASTAATDGGGAVTVQVPSPDAGETEASEPRASIAKEDRPLAEEAAKPLVRGHELVLEATDATWVQVAADGGEKDKRVLKAGESYRWQITEQAQLWLGNAGGVRATWDGKALKPFGKRGQVVRVRLPNPDYLLAPEPARP